jgi:predicted acylesterase/phospholipase RssA
MAVTRSLGPSVATKRVLVIEGGGAKGAYAFGCLTAFKARDIDFIAVAGTSAGALNALLWTTDSVQQGRSLWSQISFERVYPLKMFRWARRRGLLVRVLGSAYVMLRLCWDSARGLPIPGRPLWMTLCWIGVTLPALLIQPMLVFYGAEIIGMLFAFPVFLTSVFSTTPIVRGAVSLWAFCMMWIALLLFFVFFFGSGIFSYLADALVSGGLVWGARVWLARKFFHDNVSILSSSELVREVQTIALRPMRMQTIVTVAREVVVYDPDRTPWRSPMMAMSGPDGSVSISPSGLDPDPDVRRQWVPEYIPLSTLSGAGEVVQVCQASAALPFGIVPPVRFRGRSIYDGGVADNCPIFPFLNDPRIDEIFVILLKPVRSESLARRKIGVDGAKWSQRERLLRIADIPVPKEQPPRPKDTRSWWKRRKGPPRLIVPDHQLTYVPKVTLFYPKKSLGGLWGGTLRFEGKYARKIMARGILDTRRKLKGSRSCGN